MFERPTQRSFFVFGPRGTGKSSWLKQHMQGCPSIDLLYDEIYSQLVARPESLRHLIPPKTEWVVIDEVQRVPELLNEVHRLIESENVRFALSGSRALKI